MDVLKDIRTEGSLIRTLALVGSICAIAYCVFRAAYGTDVPKLKGIPELPNAIPFFGHLKYLGLDHTSVFHQYYLKKGWGIVQAKLGNRRILVLNSYDAAQQFMVKNASATIDRPLFYTFHGVVSKTQGGTVGTAPWNESTKRMRTAAGALMTRPAIQRSAPMLDIESCALVDDLYRACQGGKEVDARIFFQRQSLNLTLMMCYGTRIASVEDPLLHRILHVAHSVSTFRSTNNNIQDYVPAYRYFGKSERTRIALSDRDTRDVWLNELFQRVVNAVKNGKDISCISEGLLKDKSEHKLSESEIKSINVSFVSGGFETLATSGLACIGWLSTEQGQSIQEKAYQDIIGAHGSAEAAWNECLFEEKSAYVVALAREALRYYCPIPLLTPRQTIKSFIWQGIEIPKGLTVYVNGQSANHDAATYGPDADIFRPERWLEADSKFVPGPPYHYSYGAGSRMCTAVALSNRVLYATYVRLIMHFKIKASLDAPPCTDFIDFNENRSDATAIPKRFKIKLEPRDNIETFHRSVERSREETKNLAYN